MSDQVQLARIEFSVKGFYDIRSAPGVVDLVERETEKVLAAAGGEDAGYAMGSRQGASRPQGRWRGSVVTTNGAAIRDNAANNTLLKALAARRA